MTLEFLSADATATPDRFSPVARSPMEGPARAAGGRFEARDGWSVAADFGSPDAEREATRATVGFADLTALGKLELQAGATDLASLAPAGLELGRVTRTAGTWWAPLAAERALAICEPSRTAGLREELESGAAAFEGASVVDVSSAFAALALAGPMARETIARFCALDLRPAVSPVGSLRPGSVARTPGILVCEAPDRYLMLFGTALGEYMWAVVADAAESLGGRPIGIDALEPLDSPAGAEARDA